TRMSCRCCARRRPTPSMSCSERDVSGFGYSLGYSKGHFMIASGLWAGAFGGTRTPNLLIRRFLYRRSVPFRTVRYLGLVNARRPFESGASESCSSPWLPAWLPADDSLTPWPSSPPPGTVLTWARKDQHGAAWQVAKLESEGPGE